jgi:hypothetical protein
MKEVTVARNRAHGQYSVKLSADGRRGRYCLAVGQTHKKETSLYTMLPSHDVKSEGWWVTAVEFLYDEPFSFVVF